MWLGFCLLVVLVAARVRLGGLLWWCLAPRPAQVDAGGDVNIVDNQQNSLLHYVAGYGRDNIIQYLGERKLDFNAANTNGQTPMDLAKAGVHPFLTCSASKPPL